MGSSGASSKRDREMPSAFSLLLTILLSADNASGRYTHSSCFLGDTVFNRGRSVAQRSLASPQICQEWCQLVRRCTHFSYNPGTSTCFLRDGDRTETMRGYISGPCSSSHHIWPWNLLSQDPRQERVLHDLPELCLPYKKYCQEASSWYPPRGRE